MVPRRPSWGEAIAERRWAIHGTTASSGTALFSFMEFPEARHPQLESTLVTDAGAIFVYADWLEEQGDPDAAALNPQLLEFAWKGAMPPPARSKKRNH